MRHDLPYQYASIVLDPRSVSDFENDLFEFLDDTSNGRLILELRYIDGMEMVDICENMCKSRSTCYRLEIQALDELLKLDRVRDIIGLNGQYRTVSDNIGLKEYVND